MCSSRRHHRDRLTRGVEKLRLVGISEEQLQLGRQLCNQLRITQTVKGRHGVGIEAMRKAIEYPHKKRRHVFIQAALKAKRQQIDVPLNRARCFTCGRVWHYSTSPAVHSRRNQTATEKQRLQAPEAMASVAFNILFHTPQVNQKGGSHMVEHSWRPSELHGMDGESMAITSGQVRSSSTAWGLSRELGEIKRI
ncbi:unnamed protein product [Trypanosoma congolense IL3000]|uniref:WGS project CAEQ00000000 data, annotated contig 2367 n=1 Tax=Trypanosoma congolense (strain IL3000) TaxID=1068625 RepID=F9WDI1_TRYCI|nr:unnamed protein product [Trypanosoma congolense IL3000]